MRAVRGGGGGMPVDAFFEMPPPPNKSIKKKTEGDNAGKENTVERKDSTTSVASRKSSVSSNSSSSKKEKSDKRKGQEKGLYHMLQQEKEQHQRLETPPQPLQHRTRKRDKVKALFSSSSSSSNSPSSAPPFSHPPASLHSAQSSLSSSTLTLSSVLMASEHDIYLKWAHPVPEGVRVYIAGTFKVPGHGPWEKLPMTYSELNHCWEVHLDVQEVEQHAHHQSEDDHDTRSVHSTHSTHSTHSSQSTQSKEEPAKAKESRASRFFGRARSGSDKKDAAPPVSTPAPHHHEPLRKTYSYFYKFIVGDDWQCDPDRHQVQDEHGNWNHDLTVELVEQGPIALAATPSSDAASLSSSATLTMNPTDTTHTKPKGHSRTPSIRSIQSIQLPTVDETKPLPDEPIVEAKEEEQQQQQQEQPPLPQPSTDVSQGLNLTDTTAPTTITAEGTSDLAPETSSPSNNVLVKNTYEAVITFDERDDLSDGEGRSKVITDDMLSDDETIPQQEVHAREQYATVEDKLLQHADDNSSAPSFASIADKNPQPGLLGTQDEKKEVQEDEPAQYDEPHPQDELQQRQHTSAPVATPVAAHDDEKDTSALISYAAAASAAPVSQDSANAKEEEEQDVNKKEQICASLAAPESDDAPQVNHADHVATPEEKEHKEQEVASTPAPVLTTVAAAAPQPLPEEEPVQTTEPQPVAATTANATTPPSERPVPPPLRRLSYAQIAAQPAPAPLQVFTLQDAADPESKPNDISSGTTAPTDPQHSAEPTTDKEQTTVVSRGFYAPSPPLTPPMSTRTFDEALASPSSSVSSQDEEQEREKEHVDEGLYSDPPMTPQSVKHSSPRALTHSKETSETSQLYEHEEHEDESLRSREVLSLRNGDDHEHFDDKAPVRFPSLLWSLTKTTVVVSATVVLLSFGFGRKKN